MDTQQIIALSIVGIAGLSLGRRLWRQFNGAGGCDGCGGNCGKPVRTTPEGVRAAPEATSLITLSTGTRPTLPRRPAPPE